LKNNLYEESSKQWEEIINKEQWSQLRIHGTTLDTIGTFVDTSTDYRIGLNDITHSIGQQRQQEANEAQRGR
jgi:hypothetical protein